MGISQIDQWHHLRTASWSNLEGDAELTNPDYLLEIQVLQQRQSGDL
jgi:hypothetical protein